MTLQRHAGWILPQREPLVLVPEKIGRDRRQKAVPGPQRADEHYDRSHDQRRAERGVLFQPMDHVGDVLHGGSRTGQRRSALLVEHLQSGNVPAPFERSVEPDLHDLQSQLERNHARAER